MNRIYKKNKWSGKNWVSRPNRKFW